MACPQAINTGDTLFSLSRIALHRLTDLGFPDRTVLRLMRLFDETCLALCEGQYLDIAMSDSDELMSVDLYFDMIGRKTAALIAGLDRGRRAAGHRGRGGHRPLPRLRLGARAGLPAQRRPARHLGRRSRRPARSRRTSPSARRRCRSSTPWSMPGPRIASGCATLVGDPGPDRRRDRRDHRHPRADRRPRLHPRPGPALPGRGARRARRRRGRPAGGPCPARGDHRLGHRGLSRRDALAVGLVVLGFAALAIANGEDLADAAAVGRLDGQGQAIDA